MLTSKLSVPNAPCHFDLEERRPILVEKHQDTTWAINTLANTLGALGQVDEAVVIGSNRREYETASPNVYG